MKKCPYCGRMNPAGVERCERCGEQLYESDEVANPGLEDRLRELLGLGQKIEAIKVYREATGAGLNQAKDAVEGLERGQTLPGTGAETQVPAGELEGRVRSLLSHGRKIEAIKFYREATGVGLKEAKDVVDALERAETLRPERAPGHGPDFEEELLELLREGNKIMAIKLYRERTGVGLREALDAVEGLARQHGL